MALVSPNRSSSEGSRPTAAASSEIGRGGWDRLTAMSLPGEAGQVRAVQGRAGQGRAVQGRTGRGRAGQGRAGQLRDRPRRLGPAHSDVTAGGGRAG